MAVGGRRFRVFVGCRCTKIDEAGQAAIAEIALNKFKMKIFILLFLLVGNFIGCRF